MRAMLFEKSAQPLRKVELPVPKPGAGQLLIRVHACAVCRTDLHVVDGDLTQPKLPLIPGDAISPVAINHESVKRKGDSDVESPSHEGHHRNLPPPAG